MLPRFSLKSNFTPRYWTLSNALLSNFESSTFKEVRNFHWMLLSLRLLSQFLKLNIRGWFSIVSWTWCVCPVLPQRKELNSSQQFFQRGLITMWPISFATPSALIYQVQRWGLCLLEPELMIINLLSFARYKTSKLLRFWTQSRGCEHKLVSFLLMLVAELKSPKTMCYVRFEDSQILHRISLSPYLQTSW